MASSGRNSAAALWLTVLFEMMLIDPKIRIAYKTILMIFLVLILVLVLPILSFLFLSNMYCTGARTRIKTDVTILSNHVVPTEVFINIEKVSYKPRPNSDDKLYTCSINNPVPEVINVKAETVSTKDNLLVMPRSV